MLNMFRSCLYLAAVCLALTACVVEQPVPVPAGPSKYDRAFNAALGGVQDAGVTISYADPASGVIRGSRDGIPVTVNVSRQGDGSVQVRFDAQDPMKKDPQLPTRFSQAYDRRMGR
jgi:hypothetical protein